jgi:phospholipid/cholesterol/gamma-HCH transport system substrate-binding protein
MYERRKRLLWANLKVGLVVTAAIAIVFFAVFFWGRIGVLFAARAPLMVRIPSVGGLRNGAPVWLLGVEIGRVDHIELQGREVIVTLSILRSKMEFIHQDARAEVLTMGLLGDKFMSIEPGTQRTPSVEPGAVIPGYNPPELGEIVEASVRSVEQVELFFQRMDRILTVVETGEGIISSLLTDSALGEDIQQFVADARSITQSVRSGRGTLGRMVRDPSLYRNAVAAIAEYRQFGRMLTDSTGTLHKLVVNDTLYDNLNRAAAQLATVMTRIEAGQGVAGSLISDREMAEDVATMLRSINALLLDIRRDPGRYFSFELF